MEGLNISLIQNNADGLESPVGLKLDKSHPTGKDRGKALANSGTSGQTYQQTPLPAETPELIVRYSAEITKFVVCGLCAFGVCCASYQPSQAQDTADKKNRRIELQAAEKSSDSKDKGDRDGWRNLLPQKSIDDWKKSDWEVTDFGVETQVTWNGKQLVLEMGDPLNGINYRKKDFPKQDFEIYLEAKRVEGSDFLCGLTFPVGKQFCSFVAGGWGGGVVGLSNVDGFDASENETSSYFDFKNGEWYKFRVRVDRQEIRTWINEKQFFIIAREGREFDTRIEMFASQPLGLSAYLSKVIVREFKWRPVVQPKKAQTKPKPKNDGVGGAVEPIE